MTETWILILHFNVYIGGGATSADFYTKEKCETAGKLVEEMYAGYQKYQKSVNWICVEK